ncbi:secretion system protein F [Agathobacter sp.]
MNGKRNLKIAVMCVFFLVLAFVMDKTSDGISDNTLKRNDTGQGDESVELLLNADGLEKDYSYELELKEVIPSKQQADELFEQAKAQIDESFCEEGQTTEHVTGRVNMEDSYVSGTVEAEWTLSDYEIVDVEGNVLQEAFSDGDESEGRLVNASVVLTCAEYKQMYDFSFIAFADELDKSARLVKDIDTHIQAEMNESGTAELILPDEVDGVRLEWSQRKSGLVAKIALLEVVAIVLLFLSKKEKQKNELKERNVMMQLEYPEIVSKMAVLMGAGMTVEQAWNRITARYLDKRQKEKAQKLPAYEEMLITEREISDGEIGRKAYAGFAERVNIECYQRFIRIILQSIHKGSKGVCEMLEKESDDAFNERRLLALKLGEEAGTKMLVPMMLMMTIVIAIVIAPAIINFKI